MQIRSANPSDAEQFAALQQAVHPDRKPSVDGIRTALADASNSADESAWVCESEDELIGAARIWPAPWRKEPAGFGAVVMVHPERRRAGIGTALAAVVRDHAGQHGARWLEVSVAEDGMAFARSNGGVPADVTRFARLPLQALREAPETPAGVSVVPLAGLDPEAVHAVYAETAAQVPDEAGFVIGYDWFLEHVWNSPAYDHQLSAGGVADGRLVAVSVIRRTGASVWNDMTGTLAAYRGQGLAKVVKWASLRWAADAGCEEARTLNNVRNVPMLTVNDWLGYEETSRSTTVTWTAEPSVG